MKQNDNSRRTAVALKKSGDAYIFNYLCEVFCSRINWTYNPDDGENTIATELLEKSLLYDGSFVLHNYKRNGIEAWLNFRASVVNDLSFYGYPSAVQLYDFKGKPYGVHVPYSPYDHNLPSDCVIVWDNQFHTRPISKIIYYAQRLSYINAQINAAIKNLRGSAFLVCSEGQKKVVTRMYQNANDSTPIMLLTYDNLEPESLKPQLLTTQETPEVLKTLYEAWDKTMSDFLNSIGIRSNTKVNKLSGVSDMELMSNIQNTDLILNAAVESRLKGIEQAEKLGLKGLSVSLSNFEPRTTRFDANTQTSKMEEVSNNEEFKNSDF